MSIKRYEEYQNTSVTWANKIPKHWVLLPTKRGFRRKKESNAGMKVENRLALTMKGVLKRSLDDLDGLQASEYETYQIFQKGDLAFKLIDLQNIKTSRVGIVPEEGIMSPAYIRLEGTGRIEPKYAYWYFMKLYHECIFNELGGGVRQTIGPEELLSLPLTYPPKGEQHSIASFLDRETAKIDALIAEQQRLIELLQEKRQAVISHAVTKGLDPNAPMKDSGVEWLGEVPEHWIICPLKHFCKITTGFAFKSDEFQVEGIPLVRISDIQSDGTIDLKDAKYLKESELIEHPRETVSRGDIAMAMTGGTIGKAGIYYSDEPALLNQRVCIFRAKPDCSQAFLWLITASRFYQEHIKLSSFGGAQPNISDGDLLACICPMPPLAEQERISAFIDSKAAKLGELQREAESTIELLNERRSALISAAVTGQIDVRGLATEEEP